MEREQPIADCFQCRHFYITWDPRYPRGCRQYGFKTDTLPSQKVYLAVNRPCPGFSPKSK